MKHQNKSALYQDCLLNLFLVTAEMRPSESIMTRTTNPFVSPVSGFVSGSSLSAPDVGAVVGSAIDATVGDGVASTAEASPILLIVNFIEVAAGSLADNVM